MNHEALMGQKIEVLSQQVNTLAQIPQSELLQHPELFTQVLEELSTSLEELQVSQEHMHQQNQELVATHQTIEVERQRYRELFELAPDGYLVTDIEGVIWEANRAASALLNVSQQRLVGKPMIVFVPTEARRAFRADLNRLHRLGRLQEWVVQLQPRHREQFDAALTVTIVYDWEGKAMALRWLLRDVSERRQLEEAQLRAKLAEMTNQTLQNEITQRQQLEEKLRQQAETLTRMNSLKDEFLAIVSHELRSPLNAMLGWSQMLRSRQLDTATTARALETIERNARLQAQLIEDLLDISRIVRGKLHLKIQPVNLVTVVEAAIQAVQLAANAKAIDIRTTLDSSANFVSGDPDRLQQIVWNLLSNAIKFTPEQGQIEVRLECVSCQVVITVSDTGKGISPDFLPYVFEHFRQAESATTRRHGGLGLGLAIVRQLVEVHGGTVEAASPGEGQGAVFTVRLPTITSPGPSNSAELAAETAIEYPAQLRNLAVLVVDDEPDVRELLTFILEQAGAIVTTVASVQEALLAIEQIKVDVLISDIGMPDQDGYTLIRHLRAMEAEQTKIPAIALTAYARGEDRRQALEAGFQVHLSKPIEPEALIAAIASQLE
jgi:PAS domain S-box-containing protein